MYKIFKHRKNPLSMH